MKRLNWFLIGLLVLSLTMIPLAGCGVSQSEYEALQAQHAALVQDNTSLKADLEQVQADLTSTQADLSSAEADLSSVQVELESTQADLENAQADLTSTQADLSSAQADLAKAQSEYNTLKADYSAVKSELDEIKEVYPPRDFSSLRELQDWLLANDVSERPPAEYAEGIYGKALEIQEDALKDGYIVSAWIDYYPDTEEFYINCTAVADGNVWMWNPETEELLDFSGISGLLKVR